MIIMLFFLLLLGNGFYAYDDVRAKKYFTINIFAVILLTIAIFIQLKTL